MKKIIALFLSLMIMISSVSVMALNYGEEWNNYSDSNSRVYSDVTPAHWGYDAINRVSATNWFKGYPDGTFKPDKSISREEVMKVIVTFLGLELKTKPSSYYDVSDSRWSSPYIEAGKLLFPKIVTYNGQSPFQPDAPIKREDVMYALVIAKKYNNEVTFVDQSVLNMFDDANSISANLKPYVALAVNIGLVAGKGSSIGAQDPLTRAEFATLLYRATYIGDGTGGGLSDIAEITNIQLETPLVSELTVGDSLEIRASATMSNDSVEDYSDRLNPYNSSNNNVVLMNRNVITAVNPGTAVIKFNGEDLLADKNLVINVKSPTVVEDDEEEENQNNTENEDEDEDEDDNDNRQETPDDDATPTLTKISWSVDSLELNANTTSKIKLIGTYSDGSTEDITSEYRIYSTNENVVKVDSNGKVTAIAEGTAKINMGSNLAGITVPRPITVTVRGGGSVTMESLEWSTEDIEMSVDETKTIKLYAVYSDGSKEDVTEDCVIYSLDEDIAIVEGTQIRGVSAGKTELWFESMPEVGITLPDMLNVTVD